MQDVQVDTDKTMRELVAGMPVPEFEKTAFLIPKALSQARVAIVTSAALHAPDAAGFVPNADAHFEVHERDERNLVLGHFSPNFDRGAFASDVNVVYPIDRLHEMAERGEIGSVASRHYSFAGNQDDSVSQIRLDTGPQCARLLREDGVDMVILAPV
jgi:D-proline reductase (dithiol) PrdB